MVSSYLFGKGDAVYNFLRPLMFMPAVPVKRNMTFRFRNSMSLAC